MIGNKETWKKSNDNQIFYDNPRGDELHGMRVMMKENAVGDLPTFIKKMYFQLMLLALLQVQLNLDHIYEYD